MDVFSHSLLLFSKSLEIYYDYYDYETSDISDNKYFEYLMHCFYFWQCFFSKLTISYGVFKIGEYLKFEITIYKKLHNPKSKWDPSEIYSYYYFQFSYCFNVKWNQTSTKLDMSIEFQSFFLGNKYLNLSTNSTEYFTINKRKMFN